MKRMKREKFDMWFSLKRRRSIQILMFIGVLYVVLVCFQLKNGFNSDFQEGFPSNRNWLLSFKSFALESEEYLDEKKAPNRPIDLPYQTRPERRINEFDKSPLSSLNFSSGINDLSPENPLSTSAKQALKLGRMLWQELEVIGKNSSIRGISDINNKSDTINKNGTINTMKCPFSLSSSGDVFSMNGKVMELPCGLKLGSHITVVGRPKVAHAETDTKISWPKKGQSVMVSQFMIELQGLKTVDGEDPPRILHFNPRLKGDWSGKPVIEQNTCYRMQWGTAQRCHGRRSRDDEETVDNLVKCEKWIRDDVDGSREANSKWWSNRFMGQIKKVEADWPFPFAENKFFVLTLTADLEGFHVNVDGKHVTSFPYRTGFSLEDATGLAIKGNVDIDSVFAASLPTSNLNFASQKLLDISDKWKAPPIVDEPVELFIGILSAGNHFAERMAARKSWMQHRLIKSSKAVARFFVALHKRKEVNVELKKEAEFFGDIVIVPYMDKYELVVFKTVAICEYGVRTASAKHIMKGDDDTFVRVDAVIDEAKKVSENRSLYIGNINFHHKPLRSGKWAVTHKEWPEEEYPPYANGPGYIISSDIASSILSDFEKHNLRFFKMEDVSMGMWVKKFNSSRPVEYKHSFKFCQFGCIEDYYTAHYQSPKQMICMWDKLQKQGKPLCCNIR